MNNLDKEMIVLNKAFASKEEAVQSVQADSKVEANQKVLNSQISINDKEETSRTKPALELENISLGFQKNDTFPGRHRSSTPTRLYYLFHPPRMDSWGGHRRPPFQSS